jgi:hypothetical protein
MLIVELAKLLAAVSGILVQWGTPTPKTIKWCFSAETLVQTEAGSLPMSSLSVGHNVLVHKDNGFVYEPVEYWLHRDEQQEAEFLVINGRLEMTSNHLIYRKVGSQLQSIFAGKLNAGDMLVTTEGLEEVQTLDKVTKRGIFAPVTNQGNLVVNGILASCYAETESETMFQLVNTFARYAKAIPGIGSFLFSDENGIPTAYVALADFEKFIV